MRNVKKFSVKRNKDASLVFENALLDAGYEYTKKVNEADFFLIDCEGRDVKRDKLLERLNGRPVFIYPHTPLTSWLWDGVYEPIPVARNFVFSSAAEDVMEAYGYPYPVEVVGFTRCEILPYQPTSGTRLLFVPARPRKDGGKHAELDLSVLHFILSNQKHFESITICTIRDYAFPDLKDTSRIKVIRTDPKAVPSPTQDMVDRIDNADIVIGVHTTGALAVARGKPTIFYGQQFPPDTVTGCTPAHYDTYGDLLRFPVTIEEMTIKDVLDVRKFDCPRVEEWKQMNIGSPFSADKFIRTIKGCLKK